MSRRAVLLLMLPLLLAGCAGYHIGPVTKTSFHSIAVPMFTNETLRPQLEAQISNAVIRRIQQDGSVQIQPQSRADVVLTGTVFRYQRIPLRSLETDTGIPREFRVAIAVRVEAVDRRTGETVLKSTEVEGTSDVFIGEDQQTAEMQALPLVADDIARRVAGLLLESW
ncbi:MAG TPA: LptE family protein [Verrucomicrobiae bacterium]|nr:LptE family protein [Verrucomicrobiae bacterium]